MQRQIIKIVWILHYQFYDNSRLSITSKKSRGFFNAIFMASSTLLFGEIREKNQNVNFRIEQI